MLAPSKRKVSKSEQRPASHVRQVYFENSYAHFNFAESNAPALLINRPRWAKIVLRPKVFILSLGGWLTELCASPSLGAELARVG